MKIRLLDYSKDVNPPVDTELLRYLDLTTLVNELKLGMENDYTVFEEQIPLSGLFDILDREQPKYCAINISILYPLHNDVVKEISKKYPQIFFIFFYNETFYYNSHTPTKTNRNFVCISSGIKNYDGLETDTYFSYYILNTFIQHKYNRFLDYLYKSTKTLKRQKKYLFYNGSHKPYRLKIYDLMIKNNLLDEGFFSYMGFAIEDTKKLQLFLDFFNMTDGEFNDYLRGFKIPYLCDSYELTQNIFYPFVNPPQYAFQSYVNITSETTYFPDNDWVSTSEKSFKSFLSFNIPLFFGQRKLQTYLKDLGFDLFDDLFDTSEVSDGTEMFQQFESNLKVIKNMEHRDLHEFYVQSELRLLHNFQNVINLSKQSLEKIRKKCLEF